MKQHTRLVLVLSVAAFVLTASLAIAQGTPQAKPKRINLNTATQAELEGLKGIGPALAQKIIAARPFKAVSDLKNVPGISQATYDEIKNLVTVRTTGTAAKPQAAEPTPPETKPAPKTKTAPATAEKPTGGLVNLNTADKTTLEGLPGVGPATADAIIAARPFKTVEDLKNVKGIGDAKFAKLQGLVTVGAAQTTTHRTQAASGEEEEAVQPKLKPGETININTASQTDLEKLLGIGPVKAQAIIAGRPYAKIEDIMKVKGIKDKTFAKIKDFIVVK